MDGKSPNKLGDQLKKEKKKNSKDIEERKSRSAMKEIKLTREEKRTKSFPTESSTVHSGSSKRVKNVNIEELQENVKQTSISPNVSSVTYNSTFGSFSNLYNPILMYIRSETFLSLAKRVWLTLLSEVIVSFISKISRSYFKNNYKQIPKHSEDSNYKAPVFVLANGSGSLTKGSSTNAEQDRATQVTGVSIEEFVRQLSEVSRKQSNSVKDLNADSNENINSSSKNNFDTLNEDKVHDNLHPEYNGSETEVATVGNGHERQADQPAYENEDDKSSTAQSVKEKEKENKHSKSLTGKTEELVKAEGMKKDNAVDKFISDLAKASKALKSTVINDDALNIHKPNGEPAVLMYSSEGVIQSNVRSSGQDQNKSLHTNKPFNRKVDRKIEEKNEFATRGKSVGPKESQDSIDNISQETQQKTEKFNSPTRQEKVQKLEGRNHNSNEGQYDGKDNREDPKQKRLPSSPISEKEKNVEEINHSSKEGQDTDKQNKEEKDEKTEESNALASEEGPKVGINHDYSKHNSEEIKQKTNAPITGTKLEKDQKLEGINHVPEEGQDADKHNNEGDSKTEALNALAPEEGHKAEGINDDYSKHNREEIMQKTEESSTVIKLETGRNVEGINRVPKEGQGGIKLNREEGDEKTEEDSKVSGINRVPEEGQDAGKHNREEGDEKTEGGPKVAGINRVAEEGNDAGKSNREEGDEKTEEGKKIAGINPVPREGQLAGKHNREESNEKTEEGPKGGGINRVLEEDQDAGKRNREEGDEKSEGGPKVAGINRVPEVDKDAGKRNREESNEKTEEGPKGGGMNRVLEEGQGSGKRNREEGDEKTEEGPKVAGINHVPREGQDASKRNSEEDDEKPEEGPKVGGINQVPEVGQYVGIRNREEDDEKTKEGSKVAGINHVPREGQGASKRNSEENDEKPEESNVPVSQKSPKLAVINHVAEEGQGAVEHKSEEMTQKTGESSDLTFRGMSKKPEENRLNSERNDVSKGKNIDVPIIQDLTTPTNDKDRSQRSVNSHSNNKKNKNQGNKNKGKRFETNKAERSIRSKGLDTPDELKKLLETTKGQTSKTVDSYPD